MKTVTQNETDIAQKNGKTSIELCNITKIIHQN